MDDAVSSVLAAKQASVSNQVSMTVLRKTMDSQQQEGDQMVAMIKQAGDVAKGQNTASDGGVDMYA